jgi:DNA-binding GntR family transcriptional regulator
MYRHADNTDILDRSGPVPLCYQIKRWLSSRILSDELAPGTQLPGEFELWRPDGVSSGVVRQAMTELCYEGLLNRQRGRGTFVSVPKTAGRPHQRAAGSGRRCRFAADRTSTARSWCYTRSLATGTVAQNLNVTERRPMDPLSGVATEFVVDAQLGKGAEDDG